MSVSTALGLSLEVAHAIIATHWEVWSRDFPDLALVPDPGGVAAWLRCADPAAADRVLRALAQLAAADGGDDRDAALLLAWLMMPAACRVARCIVHADIDVHVAAQLWIEVRTFSWRTTSKVAANIAGRLRKHLLAELADPTDPHGERLTRLAVVPAALEPAAPQAPVSSIEELVDLLDAGCASGVINAEGRQLLLDLIATAATEPHGRTALLGDRTSDLVAARWGVSGRTVRRWAARTIHALAETA